MSALSNAVSAPGAAALPAGRPYPLGASLRDGGVNFAVFAGDAQALELCVFDATGQETRHALTHCDDGVWHGFLAGAATGLVYGYRAHGRYAPDEGLRYNPHKLLLDPYAQEIVGRYAWRDEHYGYQCGHRSGGQRHQRFLTRCGFVVVTSALRMGGWVLALWVPVLWVLVCGRRWRVGPAWPTPTVWCRIRRRWVVLRVVVRRRPRTVV